jgi:hypothetical protein
MIERTHLAATGLVLFPESAAAQQPTQAQVASVRQLCRTDHQAHCASVPTGGSAAPACLQQNISRLSEPCQQAVQAASTGNGSPENAPSQPALPPATAAQGPATRRQQIALFRHSCAGDYRTFSDIEPGAGERWHACTNTARHSASPAALRWRRRKPCGRIVSKRTVP